MNLQRLQEMIGHTKPRVRLVGIHIAGMVDEVRILQTLATLLTLEDHEVVAKEFRAIGRHLQQLVKEGYDTVEAICEHYNVYSEVLTHADEKDFKTLHNIATEFANKDNDRLGQPDVNETSVLIVSRMLGAANQMYATTIGVDMTSNVGNLAETMQKLKRRDRPTIPTERDISRWAERLKSTSVEHRVDALVQMNTLKNPQALQYMAHTHYNDPDEMVRFKAKQLGKALYWNTIYYEMDQNGTIEKIMRDFGLSLGIALSDEVTATQEIPTAQVAQDSIADILKRAEKTRKKRGKKRR